MKTGKKRWWLVAFVLVGIVLAIGGIYYGTHRGPRYAGKSLSYWFKEYCFRWSSRQSRDGYHDPDESKADEALRTIGTNALPYLLKEAFNTNNDSSGRKKYFEFLGEFPASWHLPRYLSQEERRYFAPHAIGEISPRANFILPLMRSELNQTNTAQYNQAIFILTKVTNGTEMLVPYFARALHGSDSNTQVEALYALGRIGPKAAPAVPDLMETMERFKPTNTIGMLSTTMLGAIGSNAAPAIPLLQNLLKNETNSGIRILLAADLYKIDARQTGAFDLLMKSLTNWNDSREIGLAAWRLEWIGASAKPAIPVLLAALTTTNLQAWKHVLATLKELGAPDDELLHMVRGRLTSQADDVRVEAAIFILNHNKSDQAAQAVLIEIIKQHSEYEPEAIDALGKAGPAANAAIPVILTALDGTNMDSWQRVPQALTNMGAPAGLFLAKLEAKITPEKTSDFSDHFKLLEIAMSVLEVDPANRDAQLALIYLLKNNPALAGVAIKSLAQAKPIIKEAIPVLQDALKSSNQKIRQFAAPAVKQIEAQEKAK